MKQKTNAVRWQLGSNISKMTEAEKREAVRLHDKEKVPLAHIAQKYGIEPVTLVRIFAQLNYRWTHLYTPQEYLAKYRARLARLRRIRNTRTNTD